MGWEPDYEQLCFGTFDVASTHEALEAGDWGIKMLPHWLFFYILVFGL